jgi:hypothetical protein
MQSSLRKALIDSHVAAIAIAVMFVAVFSYTASALSALWKPALQVLDFLMTAVAIRGVPSMTLTSRYMTDYMFPVALAYLLLASTNLCGAWLLSRWVYGAGPLCALGQYKGKLSRNTHA